MGPRRAEAARLGQIADPPDRRRLRRGVGARRRGVERVGRGIRRRSGEPGPAGVRWPEARERRGITKERAERVGRQGVPGRAADPVAEGDGGVDLQIVGQGVLMDRAVRVAGDRRAPAMDPELRALPLGCRQGRLQRR